ncbi:hypothetical protein FRC11_010914 [Ceratobasidium sp. 423]|nr:hypothetical protein FRC11_010914 [Ceratobasidium sp. 423]
MKFLPLVVSAILAVSSLVQAASVLPRNNSSNDSFLSEFIAALDKNGLTTLADNYENIFKTEEGQQVIDFLENNGELTLLAPDNDAFNHDHPDIDADILLYNTLWGSIDEGFKITDHKRKRSHSQTRSIPRSGFRRRTGRKRWESLDKFQVQVIDQFSTNEWKRWFANRETFIDRAVGDARVVGRFTFQNIIVLIIDTVLSLPSEVTELLDKPLIKRAPNGLTKFREALERAGLEGLVDTRDELTMFAPIDDEFDDIDKFSKDDLSSFMENHFFFGTIIYSPLFELMDNATAESGEKLDFFFENDVHYVGCGDTRAVVLRRDVISENGVIHIIDKPLKCD